MSNIKNFKAISYGKSDVGLIRLNNEDSWLTDPQNNIFILCDGMGGHLAGEIASQRAVDSFSTLMKKHLFDEDEKAPLKKKVEFLKTVIQEVNASVYELGKNDRKLKGMGTTLCCVYFYKSVMIVGHVGDSRVYLLRNQKLSQLTKDHSLMLETLEAGGLNRRLVRDSAYRNIITRAIGVSPAVEPSLQTLDILDGDRILMCSDGLTDMLSPLEIEAVLNKNNLEQHAVEQLVLFANRRGGNDNITAILITLKYAS